ncbi:MAG TPA: hypothetical protein VHJ20_17040 [Polyangia bacterium]|nr:hypothetical protein [Polyangia bacterium]
MGREAVVSAVVDGAKTKGRALLEEAEVLLRGDVRARVPFAEIEDLAVEGDVLEIRWSGRTLSLELGADAAAKWLERIKNPPSRAKKLGLKPDQRVALVGTFAGWFTREITNTGAKVTTGSPVDLVFYAPDTVAELKKVGALKKRLEQNGALWVIRPKGKDSPITEHVVRAAGIAAGLVDVKVAAFSATHSAQKFVIPVAKRR